MGTLNLKTNAGGSVIFEPQNTATDQINIDWQAELNNESSE